jgi:hypothetical protein
MEKTLIADVPTTYGMKRDEIMALSKQNAKKELYIILNRF